MSNFVAETVKPILRLRQVWKAAAMQWRSFSSIPLLEQTVDSERELSIEPRDPFQFDRVHPILARIDEPMPPILGLNKQEFRGDDASTLLAVCQYRGRDWPLLAVRIDGNGLSLIWSTDIGGHWLSREFLEWRLYGRMMANIVTWLGHKDGAA